MNVHFTWDISAGQIIVSLPLFWIIAQLWKVIQMLMRFRIEHEELMIDWAARQNPPRVLAEMPTRQSKWW